MTIRHLFGREDTYTITTNHTPARFPWMHRRVSLDWPHGEVSAEWNVLGGSGFGLGFQAGRNGGESDMGLNIYAGRLASMWLRFRSPWTTWARVRPGQPDQYDARHTGVVLFPHRGCWLRAEFEAREGKWSRDDPWYRHLTFGVTDLFGRVNHDTVTGDSGVTRIPLPEGVYLATWTEKLTTRRYVRWPGKFLDLVRGRRTSRYIDLSIEGGIPVEGKGENSYDCGMDGLFGTGGATIEAAVGNAVEHVLKYRQRYGGPHDLPRPMTVREASERERA